MNQVVTTNGIEIGIGKKGEGVAGLLTQVAGILRTINADGDGPNPGFIKSVEVLLNTPQLGVA
jgi:hypothetical protein